MSDVSFHQIKDDVQELARAIIEENLSDKVYRAESAKSWGEAILGELVRQLEKFPDFKFVTTCIFVSKDPNAFCARTRSLWDRANDGSTTVYAPFPSMDCHVTVYGLKY
jgi:hypothetical protein